MPEQPGKRAFMLPMQEGLELHAEPVRYVLDLQGREVRLAGLGAQAREFRHLDADAVIALGLGVVEGLEVFAWRRRHRCKIADAVAGLEEARRNRLLVQTLWVGGTDYKTLGALLSGGNGCV